MITKAYKIFCQMALLATNNGKYAKGLPANDVSGNAKFIVSPHVTGSSYSVFPNVAVTFRGNATSAGFKVGSGDTTPTENDYTLESLITTVAQNNATFVNVADDDGDPCTIWQLTVTNTDASDITVKEVGFFQTLSCVTTQGSSSGSAAFMLDRTVLSTPVTIAPGTSKIINYMLKVPV